MLSKEQLDAFILEISTFGNIPISSQNCGIGCIFCKVQTDPVLKKYPSIPPIDIQDLKNGFDYINPKVKYVRLGAGVLIAPHTDPYLHPLIYDFIKCTAEHFTTKKITTVTTGSYIEESKIEYLRGIPNFSIDLSLITMQEQRETIVPRTTRNRIMTILQKAPLNKVTLMFTGNMDDLKRDIDLLYEMNSKNPFQEILVRRIEYTGFSHGKLNSIAENSINGYEDCVSYLKGNHPNIIYTVPSLKNIFRGGNNEYFDDADLRINQIKEKVISQPNKLINIICPESSYEYFKSNISNISNVKVSLVKNKLYGGSVCVAGLLNHQDIFSQYKQTENEIIVLPTEMYNNSQCDIMGSHISKLTDYYKSETWIM